MRDTRHINIENDDVFLVSHKESEISEDLCVDESEKRSMPTLPRESVLINDTYMDESVASINTYVYDSNEVYLSLLRKIGASPERVGNSLSALIKKLREEPNSAESVVKEIIINNISGNESMFLEMIEMLQEDGDYEDAYILSCYAQEILKKTFGGVSTDLYAAIIESAVCVSDQNETEYVLNLIHELSEKQKQNPKPNMSMRVYNAICEFYYNVIKFRPKLFQEGVSWAERLMDFDKTNEDGYYWEAMFLLLVNERSAAEIFLQSCIYDSPDPDRDNRAKLRCPKCCKLYFEEFLKESGSFRQIENILTKGRRDCIVLPKDQVKDYKSFFRESLAEVIDSL